MKKITVAASLPEALALDAPVTTVGEAVVEAVVVVVVVARLVTASTQFNRSIPIMIKQATTAATSVSRHLVPTNILARVPGLIRTPMEVKVRLRLFVFSSMSLPGQEKAVRQLLVFRALVSFLSEFMSLRSPFPAYLSSQCA
jgi:hypothetical protein